MSSVIEAKNNLIKNIPSFAKEANTPLGTAAKFVAIG